MGHQKEIRFFFKTFLFQGFPFSRGCPCCLKEDGCSRPALFQELLLSFQDARIADKVQFFFKRYLFQDWALATFFKVILGWVVDKEDMVLSQGSMFLAAISIPSLVSKKWSNTLYLGASLALILVELTPGLTEEATMEILPTKSSDENVQCVLGFKNLEFSTRC